MIETLFKWDDAFLIGIEELDHEHKVLIEDINRLHEELSRHDDKSVIEKCLGDIDARMRAHFALEEHVMKEHAYEYFDEHKREHDELLDTFAEYMLSFLNDTSNSPANTIEGPLKHWVITHILSSDKKMSLMVQEQESFKKKRKKR